LKISNNVSYTYLKVIKKKFDAVGLLSRKRLVVAITTEQRQTK